MIGNKVVLGVTLARGGSKSIPKKNIVPLNGRPLLWYTISQAILSKYIDLYLVSTDDPEIAQVAKDNHVHVVHRPPELATDTSTSADALIHAVESVDIDPDYVVEIMATNPFKNVQDIDGCIEKMYYTNADSVVSVVRIFDHHPSRVKYIENDQLISFWPEEPESRRQDLRPEAYVRNGSIYVTTVSSLRRTKSRLGNITRPYIMPPERSINIDEPRDLLIAEILGREHEIQKP